MPYLAHDDRLARRHAARRRRRLRRRLAALGVGVTAVCVTAIVLASVVSSAHPKHGRLVSATAASRSSHRFIARVGRRHVAARGIAPLRPGFARVYMHGPTRRREVALTFDDGACAACAARIIRTLARTGAHASIFPNGRYASSWDPLAHTIRRLVAAGQLTIGNHTFLHHDAREESPEAFELDLANDERWIERTFGVGARPFFRPPYGAYAADTLSIAGQLGYTKVIIWSGTVADSSLQTPAYILAAVRHWARPGAIILMHANYLPTALVLPQILAILHREHLRAVTVSELLRG